MLRRRILRRYLFNASVLNSSSRVYGENTTTPKKTKEDAQVVVIGAGLAGLSAAAHLIKKGFRRTILLEATERLGGRVASQRFGDAFCELGAKWIAADSRKDSIYEVLQHANGVQKRMRQQNLPLYVNTKGKMLNKRLPELVDMLFKQICSGIEFQEKYLSGEMHNLSNVHKYLNAETKKLSDALFEGEEREVARDIFTVLSKEFGSSLGCCLQYVNIEHITQLPKLNNWPLYIPNGLDNLLGHIAKDIGKDNMHCGKPVGEIRWLTNTPQERKIVGCFDGSVYVADHILCTLPLGVLKNVAQYLFVPALPEKKKKAIEQIGFGSPIKMYMEFKTNIRPWFKANIRPLWSADEHKHGLNWTKQVIEISRMPSSNRVVEVSIGGEFYALIEKLPDAEVIEEVTQMLRTFFNDSRIPYPVSLLRSNWSSSPCYLGGRPYISTHSSFGDVVTLAEPLGERANLLFAGDATTLSGFGTIDGARMSGIREAERIMKYYDERIP